MKTSANGYTILHALPGDYKGLRLRTWSKLPGEWLDYTRKDSFHRHSLARVEQMAYALARVKSGRAGLIDLGCGPGIFLRDIRLKHNWARLAGVDFCPKMIAKAGSLDNSGLVRIDFALSDLELPLRNDVKTRLGKFDVAVSTFVIDEVANLDAFFRVARELLVPDGYFLCAMLDESRERERYELPAESAKSEKDSILIRMDKTNDYGLHIEYYSIVRSRAEPVEAATCAGLIKVLDRTFTPTELGSRPTGPSLRILQFKSPAPI